MKKLLLIIFSHFLISPTVAIAETNNDTNIWYGFFNKATLNSQFSWWAETQLRYNLDTEGMGQTLVRTGLLAPVKGSESKSEFGLLYAYIQSGLTKEHRLTLQHSISYLSFLEGFSHRIRYEFRTLEAGSPLSNRFRYLLRYQGPSLFSDSKLIVWNEIFLNIEKSAFDEIDHFDRNRLFLGLKVPLENISIELGYLNQWAPRSTVNRSDHVATFYLFF